MVAMPIRAEAVSENQLNSVFSPEQPYLVSSQELIEVMVMPPADLPLESHHAIVGVDAAAEDEDLRFISEMQALLEE